MPEATQPLVGAELNGTNADLFGDAVPPEESGNPADEGTPRQGFFEDVDFNDTTLAGDDKNTAAQEGEATPPATETEPQQPTWIDPTKPDLTPEQAAEHWKNRHVNSQEFITKLQGQIGQYGEMSPEYIRQLQSVESLLSQNPDLIDQLYNRASGAQEPTQPQPVKVPEYYDASEALDPSTQSGQWKAQQDQLQQQALLGEVRNVISETLSRRDEAQRQREIVAARNSELAALQTNYGMDQAEAAQFGQFLKSGSGRELTLEDKYRFYLSLNNIQPHQAQAPQVQTPALDSKIKEIQSTTRKRSPGTTPTGGQLQDLNPQEVFNRGLLNVAGPKWKIG